MNQVSSLRNMKGYAFDDKYYADEYGNVYLNEDLKYRKMKKGDKIKSFINRYGYVEYNLQTENRKKIQHIQAHRIVASLFIPNPENKSQVNHIDGNKLNNHVFNLEWCTPSENELHSYRVLGKINSHIINPPPSGYDYKGLIKTVKRIDPITKEVKVYFNPTEATKDGFNLKCISNTCMGRQKTHKGYLWEYIMN